MDPNKLQQYALHKFDSYIFQQDLLEATKWFLAMKTDEEYQVFCMALIRYEKLFADLEVVPDLIKNLKLSVYAYYLNSPNTMIYMLHEEILEIIKEIDNFTNVIRLDNNYKTSTTQLIKKQQKLTNTLSQLFKG